MVWEEASRRTRTFDIVWWISARRLQWVGHILRMDERRLVHKAAEYIRASPKEGWPSYGRPPWLLRSVKQELRQLTKNRNQWRKRVLLLHQPPWVEIDVNDEVSGTRIRVHCPIVSLSTDPRKPRLEIHTCLINIRKFIDIHDIQQIKIWSS